MTTFHSSGLGRSLAGEKDLVIRNRLFVPSGNKGIIGLHGRNGDAFAWVPNWIGGDHARAWPNADPSQVLLSIDGGGLTPWANNAALASIDAAYTYLTTVLGCGPKVGIMAWSMGGLGGLNWIKRNPAKVAAALLWCPATNINIFHGNATYTAEIDTAYGGAGVYAANVVGHDPATEFAAYKLGIKIRIRHAQDDGTVPVAQSRAFVAGVADPLVDIEETPTGDHTALFANYTTASTVAFFQGGAW